MSTPSARAAWALAIGAGGLLGCPTSPPQLRSTTLELGSETTGGDDADTDGASEVGSDAAATSIAEGPAGASSEDDDALGDDTFGGESEPSCWASPSACTDPSPHIGPGECDPYAQDCPPGEKCMPISTDGQWTSTACRSVANAPAGLAEPCTIVGEAGMGFDDCDVGLLCRSSDDTTSGRCRELCGCGPLDPTCQGPATTCVSSGDLFGLCLPACDPFAQDCVAPEGCYFTGERFVCTKPTITQPTAVGDPCESANGCSPGQMCIGAEYVPGCTGAIGCCTTMCSVDGEPACSGTDQVCAPLWGATTPPADCPLDAGACVTLPA